MYWIILCSPSPLCSNDEYIYCRLFSLFFVLMYFVNSIFNFCINGVPGDILEFGCQDLTISLVIESSDSLT